MKVEARIFELLTIFFFAVGTLYLILSQEPAGSAALYLTGGLSLLVGTYFRFVARRLECAARGQPGGEVSDGAGDVGFFSPGSYWPIGLAGRWRSWPSRSRSCTTGRSRSPRSSC